ncbi:MAG: S53 family peptidase [Candidatus Acidiferrales bacterium]
MKKQSEGFGSNSSNTALRSSNTAPISSNTVLVSVLTNAFRAFKIIVFMLCAAGPLWAQGSTALRLPIHSESTEPITFMRAPYRLHPQATTSSPNGFTPSQIRHAYGFDQISSQGAGQIIGIVDAYDDPSAESDLGVFNQQYGLPACTSSNGCFRKIYSGSKRPAGNANWSLEISLDIEWAHAIAPKATILLVEASSNSLSDLLAGVDAAVRNGASVVSMSWTVGEFKSEANQDNHFVSSGVTFFAASGDAGTGATYPAASPDVVGVGGTALVLDVNGNYQSEIAWSGSGGGLSLYEREPMFQSLLGIPNNTRGYRGAPDVSYNANPGTGFAVYDSVALGGAKGWFRVGGTSAGSPQWAALVAIANSMRVANRKARLSGANTQLYALSKSSPSANFHPVTIGTNGACGTVCNAGAGYDYVTGIGTPSAATLISVLAAQ